MSRKGLIARRSFLRRAALAAALPAATAARPARAAERPTPSPRAGRGRTRLEALTRDDFVPRIGATFRIEREGGRPLHVRLAEATDLGVRAGGAPMGRAPFSLAFEGAPGDRLAQGTYRVALGALGTFALLLVPVGRPGRVVRYEAVFG
jgi:hypothetical protein